MKVLMLLDNAFVNDGRVLREAACLVDQGYEVNLHVMPGKGLNEKEVINGITVFRDLPVDILDVKKIKVQADTAQRLAKENFDVIHAHDQHMLHLARLIKDVKPGVPLIYDSHEMFHAYPLNFGQGISLAVKIKSWIVRYWQQSRERKNSAHIDYLITVTDTIADILKQYFSLKNNPVVVRNAPELEVVDGSSHYLRNKFNIPAENILVVHFAAHIFLKSQNLDWLLTQLGNIEKVSLVFINKRQTPNSQEVETFVKQKGYTNVLFHDAIPLKDIHNTLATADVGVVTTYNKKDLSYWLALDNKLFHYIMAEIPILATAQPEYENIVLKNDVGVCIIPTENEAYTNGLNKIKANYTHYKQQTAITKKQLNWDAEKQKLIDLYLNIDMTIKH